MMGNSMPPPTQPPAQPPAQPRPRVGSGAFPAGARIAIGLVLVLILGLVVFQAQPGAVVGPREASTCGSVPSFDSAPRADTLDGAQIVFELPQHSAISVGDTVNDPSYTLQTIHVCTPYSTPFAISLFFSLTIPNGSQWLSSSQFPFDGAHLSACSGPCWQTAAQPQNYLAVANEQLVGTVAVYDIVEAEGSA